ncbi:MAG: prolyl oligopeptidase family serine peptidase [Micromonosporaceae bacterium]|nr:prolyl oligopeptidase family serine peptidase [Micromonosporaceae bacterium]
MDPSSDAAAPGARPGTPHAIALAEDGSRATYLRSGRLWLLDVATGAERAVAGPAAPGLGVPGRPVSELADAVDEYAADAACRVAACASGGRLYRADLDSGAVTRLDAPGPAGDPRPDPTGRRVAYLCQSELRVVDEHGRDHLLAGERDLPNVAWGTADPVAAEAFGRTRGYWWAPDGERVLAARVQSDADGSAVSLHLLDLDGSWVDVRWDRLTYPYLAAVTWTRPGPLATVLPRNQRHALVLSLDVRTGETQVHAELDDPRWVTIAPGTPAYLPDGRVVLGGELSLDAVDTRCLFADGTLLTPTWLHVRRLCGFTAEPGGWPPERGADPGAPHLTDLVVEGNEGEPSEQHVYRVRLSGRSGSPEVSRLTSDAGWHRGRLTAGALVIESESLEHSGARVEVRRGAVTAPIPSHAPEPAEPPRPVLMRVTDRRLPCGVLFPADHVTGRRLPVLLQVDGSPAAQSVVAARDRWLGRQRLADTGFAVLVTDARGAPGVSPSFEKVVHRRLWDLTLADQTDALSAAAAKHPDLDLDRVAIRGAGFGGSIAVAAALRYPEVFAAAVAESPVVDWSLLRPVCAERYLGSPEENPEAYARHNLLAEAAGLRRPLLLAGADQDRHVEQFAAAARFGDPAAAAHVARQPAGLDADDALEYQVAFLTRALGGRA